MIKNLIKEEDIRDVDVKSVMTKSTLPVGGYSVNPYVGCPHACKYCYASFMKRFTGHTEPWGTFLDVKHWKPISNPHKYDGQRIVIGSVTDGYNPYEERFGRTREILKELQGADAEIMICTKSDLVLRDLDLLKTFKKVTVSWSVNTLDDNFRADMDCASSIVARLKAMKEVYEAGIRTVCFRGCFITIGIGGKCAQSDINRYFCSMIQREVFKGVNSIKFYNRFKSDEDCLKYLSEIKWPDEAFVCARCGNATYHKGRTPYSRRCNKCKHDESVTAGTMLDRMKLAPLFAFHIAFKIATKKKGMSSLELAEEYELRQKTVWEFKWKLQQAMKSSGKYPLTGNVHVDEFYIGGEEEGITGRSSESAKKLVVVALEIVTDGVGRAYAQVIDDASAKSFRPFFTKYISKDAKVVTDEWKGYLPLMDEYQIEQRKSENGKSFPQMHIHIMNIKGWLRGIHHHCTKERLQGYLDEYHFRFNRRNNMDTIFDVLMRRLMNNEPIRINSNN